MSGGKLFTPASQALRQRYGGRAVGIGDLLEEYLQLWAERAAMKASERRQQMQIVKEMLNYMFTLRLPPPEFPQHTEFVEIKLKKTGGKSAARRRRAAKP